MPASFNSQRALAVVLTTLLAAIAVVVLSGQRTPPAPARASTLDGPSLPAGLRAARFSLIDQDGHRVTLSRYRGRVVVLTFIHSLCRDTCPFMAEQIKGALDDLPARGAGVSALGITVAPGEDTVPNRRAFLARHELTGRMAFLAGTMAQMRRVWRAYAIQPVAGKLDHSTFVLLVDKAGIERVGFPADQLTPEGLAHDIRALERERT